jgi:hypothetical protein
MDRNQAWVKDEKDRGHHFSGKTGCGESVTATQRYSFRVDSNSGGADQWLSLDGGRMRCVTAGPFKGGVSQTLLIVAPLAKI